MDPFDLQQWTGFREASGQAVQNTLIDQITIDSRRIDSPNALFVALLGAREDGHRFIKHAAQAGARFALVRNDWQSNETYGNLHLLRVKDPLKAFQQIAGTYRKQFDCKVVGITGSYGKTMVKDFLHALIGTKYQVVSSPESFNSQIGVSLSLLTIKKHHQIALIEAGISQKGEMDTLQEMIAPDYSILTHIGKKHITTLGSLRETAEEMIKLLCATSESNWVILPNDPLLKHLTHHIKSSTHFWNEKHSQFPHAVFVSNEHQAKMTYRIDYPDQKSIEGEATKGFNYFLDLLNISLKAAWLFGIDKIQTAEILSRYSPEPMRTETWKSMTGATFINDPYCSDPQSVDRALKHLEQSSSQGRKIFVFGGMKGHSESSEISYRRIGKAINRAKIDMLMLTGEHPFEPLVEEIKTHSPHTEITCCENFKTALYQLKGTLQYNDTILLKGSKKESLDVVTEVFNDSLCNNQCLINLAVVEANIATIRKKLPSGNRIMAMVKAIAYGTDEVRMARFLISCGIDILGVSYVDEAVVLKRAGVAQSIFVINAAIYEAAKIVKWELEVGVSEKGLIESLSMEAAKLQRKIKVHLHVDTGMSRFGCRPEEALELARLIQKSPFLEFEGIMTHFACADNPAEDPFTHQQVHCFEKVIEELQKHGIDPPWKHAANSSGTVRFHFPQFNMVRIGLAIYGLYSSEATKEAVELSLALSLLSRIVGINICKPGESISYGRKYKAEKERRIAVLPIGYFDGLHRNYSGKGVVIIRGHKAPMVGNICMDFMMVDVTDIPNAAIGDSVLIFGEDEHGHYLSPEDLAMKGDSIIHELITCLGPRIQRVFVHEEGRFIR